MMNCSDSVHETSVLTCSFITILSLPHISILPILLKKCTFDFAFKTPTEEFLWFKGREVEKMEVVSKGQLDRSLIGESLKTTLNCSSSKLRDRSFYIPICQFPC